MKKRLPSWPQFDIQTLSTDLRRIGLVLRGCLKNIFPNVLRLTKLKTIEISL